MICVPTSATLGARAGITASRLLTQDPLAGIPLLFRPVTNKDGVTPADMFQDTGLTNPATLPNDNVAGWFDGLNPGSQLTLVNGSASIPALQFDSGFPIIRSDAGVDAGLQSSTIAITADIVIVARIKFNSNGGFAFHNGDGNGIGAM